MQLRHALRLGEKVEGVRAAAPGVVEAVGYAPHYEGYGRVVLVDLGGGLEALYAHLDQAAVTVGEQVSTGERLGIAGCTGTCFGTHLHFELRERGIASGACLAQRAWHRFSHRPRESISSPPRNGLATRPSPSSSRLRSSLARTDPARARAYLVPEDRSFDNYGYSAQAQAAHQGTTEGYAQPDANGGARAPLESTSPFVAGPGTRR